MTVLDTLANRGFIEDCTNLPGLEHLLSRGPVTAYIGFDPTASSLHAGSLVQLMAMAHLQRAGHRVIALLGTGTALVGDPSGKTEARPMLTRQSLEQNARGIAEQLRRFVDLDGQGSLLQDNRDWLLDLGYIDFLRDIGRHFSVNRMLSAEAYKIRMEKGLSFLEFNYQLLQAYDFLVLFRRHGCRLQLGGRDQWGNIVAGIDLVRREEQCEVFGLTTPLVTTGSGEKMGKTAAGAAWLDGSMFPPYDYYQFWRNTPDKDVGRFLRLFTFLSLEEIHQLEQLQGADINSAKERLAFETTALLHGREQAVRAQEGARAAFGGGGARDEIPTHETTIPRQIVDILVASGLCSSKSDARRQLKAGAIKLGPHKITDIYFVVTPRHLDQKGSVDLRRGKKRLVRIRARTTA